MTSNINSLNAHSNWMANSAENVANINTKNYHAIDTVINDQGIDNIKANSSRGNNPTSLSKETTDQIVDSTGFDAQVKAIKTQDDIVGTLLNMLA